MSTSEAYETIRLETDTRGVARLTLNRPEARNAMSQQMIRELQDAARQLAADENIRAVVFTGEGDVFCAGGDLKSMQTQAVGSREDRIRDATELARTLADWNTLPKLVIGRINGSAYGGGLGLISVCDIAIGIEAAKFCLTEVRLGLIPATISPYVVAKLGVPHARRVMLNATEMKGMFAREMGLLDEVVPDIEALDRAVETELQRVLRCAPGAVGRAKELIRFVSTHDVEQNIEYTAARLADAWESPEVAAGIQAFLTKSRPPWHVAEA